MIALHEPKFDEEDERFVLETLRSSWVSTGGPFVKEFEDDFARFVGCDFAVSVSNGTVAIQLILDTLKRTRLQADEPFDVVVPSLSFIATHNAVVHAGGYPIFVDTAPQCMNIGVESLGDFVKTFYSFNKSQKMWINIESHRPLLAIMPAHIMGWSCDMQALAGLCGDLQIPLIEDAAEALGSYDSKGQHLGTLGLASAFSFNGNKILTTGGGGMIATNNPEFAARAKHLSTTAKTDTLRFAHDEVGYNFRLVNILAALGVSQLRKLPKTLAQKKQVFQHYEKLLSGHFDFVLHTEPHTQSNHWLVNLRFRNHERREAALKHLNDNHVQARPLWIPAHKQEAFRAYVQPCSSFLHAEDMWKTALSLPSSAHLKFEEISLVTSLLKNACKRNF